MKKYYKNIQSRSPELINTKNKNKNIVHSTLDILIKRKVSKVRKRN